ncbi:MAG: hypothetical protein AAF335_04770, partial [Bacteroidota bacterium]
VGKVIIKEYGDNKSNEEEDPPTEQEKDSKDDEKEKPLGKNNKDNLKNEENSKPKNESKNQLNNQENKGSNNKPNNKLDNKSKDKKPKTVVLDKPFKNKKNENVLKKNKIPLPIEEEEYIVGTNSNKQLLVVNVVSGKVKLKGDKGLENITQAITQGSHIYGISESVGKDPYIFHFNVKEGIIQTFTYKEERYNKFSIKAIASSKEYPNQVIAVIAKQNQKSNVTETHLDKIIFSKESKKEKVMSGNHLTDMVSWKDDGSIVFCKKEQDQSKYIFSEQKKAKSGASVKKIQNYNNIPEGMKHKISPNGKYFVFYKGNSEEKDQFFSIYDFSKGKILENYVNQDFTVAWSHDGKKVAFIELKKDDEDKNTIYIQKVNDNSMMEMIGFNLESAAEVSDVAFSRDNKSLFILMDITYGIRKIDIENKTVTKVEKLNEQEFESIFVSV